MNIVKHRPRHDEALLPVAKPVMRPTGVDAVPLRCAPGTGRAVLDQLRAELDDRPLPRNSDALRQAFDAHGVPRGFRLQPVNVARVRLDEPDPLEQLFAMLAEPVTDPRWKHQLFLAEQRALGDLSVVRTGATHDLSDTYWHATVGIGNKITQHLTTFLALDGDLVDAYAALIESEATL